MVVQVRFLRVDEHRHLYDSMSFAKQNQMVMVMFDEKAVVVLSNHEQLNFDRRIVVRQFSLEQNTNIQDFDLRRFVMQLNIESNVDRAIIDRWTCF